MSPVTGDSDYSGISNQSSNDPNEIFLGVSDEEDEDERSGHNNNSSRMFSESFSKSSSSFSSVVPPLDASEILRTLNSTLDQSRADPSAIDISSQCLDESSCVNESMSTDENNSSHMLSSNSAAESRQANSNRTLSLASPPMMQSTPMSSGKVFKRRNTAMSHTATNDSQPS